MNSKDHAQGKNGFDGQDGRRDIFSLCLYITGSTPRSSRAVMNIRTFCDRFLLGRCDLQIVDLYQQPEMARSAQILASPTLVKRFPLPLRKIVGDFSDNNRMLQGLQLAAEGR